MGDAICNHQPSPYPKPPPQIPFVLTPVLPPRTNPCLGHTSMGCSHRAITASPPPRAQPWLCPPQTLGEGGGGKGNAFHKENETLSAPRGPMAAPSPASHLPSEASCPICLEYFRDPVSIHCGHNFCRDCIARCWERSTGDFCCPQCKETAAERILCPNRELARMLEIARRLSLQAAQRDAAGQEGCKKHREPLSIYCKDDEAFICLICRESRLHRAHVMLPVQDAVQEYKEQIQSRLQALKEGRDKLLGFREAEMRRNWEYLEKTSTERQKVLGVFEGLRLFLEEQERHLLAQLENTERDVEKTQEENVTILTKEISQLDAIIQETEEKCQQPASQFLQDIRSTVSRYEGSFLSPSCSMEANGMEGRDGMKWEWLQAGSFLLSSSSRLGKENFQQPVLLLPDLERKLSHFREKNNALEEILKNFKEILMFELPEKTHPQLSVSADGSSVRWEDARRDAAKEEFGTDPFVLGCEGVTSGRCCWEVEVAPEGSWAVGVAKESLKRREESGASPEVELWSMGFCEGQIWALSSFERMTLPQIQVPKRVRVTLDYERGQVAFFDADKRALIFIFPSASFQGESIHPWFLVWGEGSQITLCP
ncbi:E3 ubiquitin-protein ligase TRIM7-like isoform X2 [Tympanuchus pallidicinctus]|uniref:E3 ubiquitin-protein ligase TRIM7-like isoform X2 n=1 Tax=Tympanuchus pallidicinctus TaxID=109042 RepID=UPI002286EA03|nr:E3 ubiquitin-protein ligase TRIM7-like isoform X2 [Tympanuchus pallidicinctus]